MGRVGFDKSPKITFLDLILYLIKITGEQVSWKEGSRAVRIPYERGEYISICVYTYVVRYGFLVFMLAGRGR